MKLVVPLLVAAIGARADAQRVQASTDSVIRFNIAARTWRWPYFAGHVGVSCQGPGASVGTTTAPDSAARARDGYCAGALVEMYNSTLTLRGARGEVHVRVNGRLTDRRAPASDSTRVPRR